MILARLLDDALDRGSEAELDADLDRLFGVDAAVLVVDLADFTTDTIRFGLTHELLAIRRMERAAAPVIASHRGRLVKTVGDAVIALFPSAAEALAAGQSILAETPGSAAVGFGRILDFGSELYGAELNEASHLQQRHQAHGVVALTAAAQAQL